MLERMMKEWREGERLREREMEGRLNKERWVGMRVMAKRTLTLGTVSTIHGFGRGERTHPVFS